MQWLWVALEVLHGRTIAPASSGGIGDGLAVWQRPRRIEKTNPTVGSSRNEGKPNQHHR